MVHDASVREVRYLDAGNVKANRLVFLCVGAIALLLESPCLYAFCETEAMSACGASDQQCVSDAATAVTHALRDCKASVAGNGNAQLWTASQNFFDGQPQEKQFWRCVATACASAAHSAP
jgi:hypothetical protein